jgi:S-adenosylmethionine synthetase
MRDKGEFLFTSESVSEGHPDKVADRLSDTVLDAYLGADPYSRVACETLVTTNRVIFAGETRGPATVTSDLIHHLARMAIHDIGYDQDGFSWDKAEIACHLHAQSLDIAQGEDAAGNKDEGAGDQGMMFGYACRETKALMPAPIHYAHAILHRIRELRRGHDKSVHGLLPDAKSQVTLRYVDGKPVGATSVVVSTQHVEDLEQPEIKRMLWPIVKSTLPDGWMCPEAEFHVNPTGKFVTWRRRVQRQGPHQGGPFCRLCLPVSGEERRRSRAGGSLHHPDQLRDRHRAPNVRVCRSAEHRERCGRDPS